MKIAITGAHGYIGSALCSHFGEDQAVRLARSEEGGTGGEYRHFELGAACPKGLLAGIDVLIHAAHDFTPVRGSSHSARTVNIRGTLGLYENAALHGVKKIIFISSMAAFKGCRSEYGRIKWELEQATLARGGIAVRPGTVWSDASGGVMGTLERIVDSLPMVPVFGPSNVGLYLIHLDDLVAIIERLITHEQSEIVLAAAPRPYTLRQILAELAKRRSLHRCFIPFPPSLLYWPLRLAELMRVRGLPRSDSIRSFLNPNPLPDWSALHRLGVAVRSFT
ncbi:MAG: NAD-dependent epimerase/dehydratase family protein [Bdellovibrionota bacterium]|nr:MAG: NAD-dependent epimerase/dehydratase family protein [Bdellovibrionota bacterium]